MLSLDKISRATHLRQQVIAAGLHLLTIDRTSPARAATMRLAHEDRAVEIPPAVACAALRATIESHLSELGRLGVDAPSMSELLDDIQADF